MAQLRQDNQSYRDAGVTPMVVAAQGARPVRRWLEKNPQPFPWLVDSDRTVIKAYGVYNRISYDAFRMAHPSAVLIDDQGVVRFIYRCSTQWDIPDSSVMLAGLARLSS